MHAHVWALVAISTAVAAFCVWGAARRLVSFHIDKSEGAASHMIAPSDGLLSCNVSKLVALQLQQKSARTMATRRRQTAITAHCRMCKLPLNLPARTVPGPTYVPTLTPTHHRNQPNLSHNRSLPIHELSKRDRADQGHPTPGYTASRCLDPGTALDLRDVSVLPFCNRTESRCIAQRTNAQLGMRSLAATTLPKSGFGMDFSAAGPMRPCDSRSRGGAQRPSRWLRAPACRSGILLADCFRSSAHTAMLPAY